jgi:transglutaminase-like putative cysteine protease
MLLLAATDVLPRLLGLRRTFALAQRLAPVRGDEPANMAETCEQMTRAVSLAAAFYPRRAQCLEQSLTLYVLLRRRGVPADLKLGVRPRPFYAHAWVEVRGRALGEAADLPMNLVAFPSLGA